MDIFFINLTKIKKILVYLCILVILCVSLLVIGKMIYPLDYQENIVKYSNIYELDPLFVASIIRVESKFDRFAKSNKGAKGLMQILPKTGKWAAEVIGIEDYNEDLLFEPDINIRIGCWYIKNLTKQFEGNINLILAAYNGGSGNVSKWMKNADYYNNQELKSVPFKETEQFIIRVRRNYKVYRILYNIN